MQHPMLADGCLEYFASMPSGNRTRLQPPATQSEFPVVEENESSGKAKCVKLLACSSRASVHFARGPRG